MAQVVILAGGLATRMHPYTLTIPKSLLIAAGRPFIDWQLEKLASCGFDDIIICVGHLGEQICNHVGNGSHFGLDVKYSEEGKCLLGTAGALRKAIKMLDTNFLVTYGDSYLPFNYIDPLRELESHDDALGVMSIFYNRNKWDSSNVQTDGSWILCYKKNTTNPKLDHIDYGAIALRREVIDIIVEDQYIGLDVIQTELSSKQKLRAFVSTNRFFEIGSPNGLAEFDAWKKINA